MPESAYKLNFICAMSEIITAIYENGLLRPLNPLSMQNGQTVQLQILTAKPSIDREIMLTLVAAGVATPPPHRGNVEPVSEEEWRELTERLAASPSKPLSEIVIEDRGSY